VVCLCCVVCGAVYSQWWVYVRFYFELYEIPSKLLSQRKFVIFMILLHTDTVMVNHVNEGKVAVLSVELRAVW
jgi:hypothetical protein